jgi:phosphate transport system substrate-binding protein
MIKAAIGIGAALLLSVLGTAAAAAAPPRPTPLAPPTDLFGVGATAPAPLLEAWGELARKQGTAELHYLPIGSKGGLKQIKAGTVDFGVTDAPVTAAELDSAGLVQFPVAVSALVPVVNLLGLNPNELKLTGGLLAEIYLGRINFWDDPRLVAVNPKVALPHAPIQVVHRADGAGATLAFTGYLASASTDWRTSVGTGLEVAWPKGAAGRGSEGVAALVRNTPGAIGYVAWPFAQSNHLSATQLPTVGGALVAADARSFARAAAAADYAKAPGMAVSLISPAAGAWPISTVSYVLLRRSASPATEASVLAFFDNALRNGDSEATRLGYEPLAGAAKAQVRRMWAGEITGPGGKPLYIPK